MRDCPPDLLTEHEFAALHALQARKGTKADSIRPPFELLAQDIKASVSTAKRAIKSLREKGWVGILEAGSWSGSKPKANVYEIQGVPADVRQALEARYSKAKPGDKWFFDWCQREPDSRVTGTPALGSEGHQSLGSEGHYKRTRESLPSKKTTQAYKPAFEVEVVEDSPKSLPTGIAAPLPSPVHVEPAEVQRDKVTPSGYALDFPNEATPSGVCETPVRGNVLRRRPVVTTGTGNPGLDLASWDFDRMNNDWKED